MEGYEKAKLIVGCSRDQIFTVMQYFILKRIQSIRAGKKHHPEKEERIFMRKIVGFKDAVNFLGRFELEFGEPIKAGAITVEFEPKDKGGDITFLMYGTKEQIEDWAKVRARDKVASASIKPYGISFRVERNVK